jgi:hypothetical protein
MFYRAIFRNTRNMVKLVLKVAILMENEQHHL